MTTHDHTIDLTTLHDVERLLRDTDFATARDLMAEGFDPSDLAASRRTADPAPNASAEGLSPLPRRR